MACGGCMQARGMWQQGYRQRDPAMMARAVGRAVAVNVDKMRGVDVNAKYGAAPQMGGMYRAAVPYRREPTRT